MQQLSKQRMDEMLAYLVNNRVADVRGLLETNGVSTTGFSDKEVQISFLKALKDSGSAFRNSVSDLMASLLTSANFVNQPMAGFVQQPYMQFTDPVDDADYNPYSTTQVTKSSVGSSTTSSSSGSSFWSNLGSLASKDNLQSLFNTGLGAVSSSLQNKANKESEQRALELERLRLQQIQAQTELNKAGGGKAGPGGLSTGAWIGIIAGGLAVTVLIVVLVRKS